MQNIVFINAEYRVYKCRMVGNQMILIGNFAGKLTLKKGGSRPQKKKHYCVNVPATSKYDTEVAFGERQDFVGR